MRGIFQLFQQGEKVASLVGQMSIANAPRSNTPTAIRTWDLFLECSDRGLAMGNTSYDVVTPTGEKGTCQCAHWDNDVLTLAGSGPVPS